VSSERGLDLIERVTRNSPKVLAKGAAFWKSQWKGMT
jgi:hypothetical protein